MEQKLQSLLERIREEGVEKAKEESRQILLEAEENAQRILAGAEQKAKAILEQAELDAAHQKRNVEAELKLSAKQAVSVLEQEITGLITAKALGEPTREAFKDAAFVKGLIAQLIAKWEPNGEGVSLSLGPDHQQELYDYFKQQAQGMLQGGLTVKPTPGPRDGFRIGPAEEGYVLSFSSEDFQAFFAEHLRPHIKALLFEEPVS